MNFWKQVLLNLRLIKVRRFLGSFFYPLQRDALERRFQSSPNIEVFAEIGDILRAETTQRGGKFYFQNVELEICFLAEDLVRIDWQPGVLPIPYASARKDWPEIAVKFQELGDRWLISTASLQVIISLNGSLELQNAFGQTIREELPPQQKTSGWLHQAKLRSLEHIYGLGERAAPLNLRTTSATSSYQMWNYDAGGRYCPGTDPLYLCIPAYLGLHDLGSYLIFYENSYKATFSFNGYAAADFTGGALRYYLSVGTPPQLLDRYTELTGRPALPPRWVLGYHQSRWGYETETAVREVAEGFITHDLPLSAIHLDIVNPGVKADRKSELFEEGRAQEVFCQLPNGKLVIAPVWPGLCAFPDFTNPQARHWWSRQYEYLLDLGFTGFWHDMNEPGVFVLWGDPSLPQHSTQHFMEGRGGDHREAHNVYGLLQAEAAYEALSEYKPELRPFIVSRAGWAGLQRYAWTWTGDIETSWSGLRQTIPTVLNLGLSGIPYSGADIGGFKGNPSAELYLRWFQMSTFLPFFRTHSANNVKPRTPWGFGEPTLSIVREFLQLRYRLMPYLYTLAWEANQKGYPLMRPLFWADSTDQDLWDVEDAFLLGDAILVAAIVESGATSRSITLPKGYWYNFWDDTLLEGAKTVNIAAPIEQIPLLVKAGSILPMSVEKQLILHIYAPMSLTSEGRVYSDAGDGYGEWRLDEFYLKRDRHILEITWQQQGNYTFPYTTVQLHFHGIEVQQAWVDTRKVNCQNNCLEVEQFQEVRLQVK
ncbi:glycoside hydrolase family 31 protein [Nodularia spumigena CS-584]|jgi:alpha-glucosidase|uniref:glycoside hydrolase family 31 protein n=1 Tax=Nodularia spumigena TaxID=70799 RepID=UPI0000EABB32|nr:glycoside hydrolase family 31 protein [Nodularia spumigena]AHJ29790.1 Alpha-glucosidase [Nodularia spumigena CCY9414]EAW43227.1 alpha-glucosidase [Nodularia spumigena CCY9414]MDB9384610.1 glycoside hydrolase family 31 protein [Nodularia spumigena CS-584]